MNKRLKCRMQHMHICPVQTDTSINNVYFSFYLQEPSWSMEEKLSIMNSRFNKRVLIDMFVWNDDRDSSRHIIYVRKILQGIIYVRQNYNMFLFPLHMDQLSIKSVRIHNWQNLCNGSSVRYVSKLFRETFHGSIICFFS